MTAIRDFCAILIGEMKALELMKTHVVKTTLDTTLSQAVDLMDLYYTNCLPVVDEAERICGLLTDQDVLAAVRQAMTDTPGSLVDATQAGNRRVAEYMQTAVSTVSEQDDVVTLLPVFITANLERIPVLDDLHRVSGMLHRVDILQAIFEGQLDQAGA
jgi:CBS-domain-containing membrane protein